jgi:hypothetical protein
MLVFALVKKNGMPYRRARSAPSSGVTWILPVMSALLPINTLLTPSSACCSEHAQHHKSSTGKHALAVTQHRIVKQNIGKGGIAKKLWDDKLIG